MTNPTKLMSSFSEKIPATGGRMDLFSDEVANLTEWHPMVHGGTNHRQVKKSDKRLKFVPTFQTILNALTFIVIGGVMSGLSLISLLELELVTFFCGGIVGVPFLWVGINVFLGALRPVVFNFDKNFFSTGFFPPEVPNNTTCCSITKIYALQLMQKTKRASPISYELNLILKTGERVHVISHEGADLMRQDSRVLADSLDVPVWSNFW